MPFGSVTNQQLRAGKRVELVLNQLLILGEHPSLLVEHLGESNIPFWNDSIARANTNAQVGGRAQQITDADIKRARQLNRDTVAKFAVHGTTGFYHDRADAPGVPDRDRPATEKDIRNIVFALPDEVFDSVLQFVMNPENFRDRPITGDVKEIAGK